jgi:hypothetical protein
LLKADGTSSAFIINKMAMLKLIIDFGTLLICAEGARLLQEASRTACGKRSAWSTNQQPILTEPFVE